MENTILDNIEEIVANSDKVMGLTASGVMQAVPNYAVLIVPLCAYLKQLEQRIKVLEK